MATKIELETENKELQETNEALKTNVDKMAKEMEELKNMIKAISKNSTSTNISDKIDGDEEITVTSLCVGTLSISTEGLGRGSLYEFAEFGTEQEIPFNELREIVKHNQSFANNLVFYINDPKVVKKLHLNQSYNKYISADEMKNILTQDTKKFVKLYEKASTYQKDNIVSLLCNEKLEGKNVDANILAEIGKITGRDLLGIEKME